jgi:hypothetical protein
MTGFLHEREFSRKTFLKCGGAMIIGFSLAWNRASSREGAG